MYRIPKELELSPVVLSSSTTISRCTSKTIQTSTKACISLSKDIYGYSRKGGTQCASCFTQETSKPMPRKDWSNDAPDLTVQALTEYESPIATHFSKTTVQCVGSTSGCGCDFPHVMFQNRDWPWFDDGEHDAEQEASDHYNREGLISLLQATGEQ